LGEDVFKAFVVCIDIADIAQQIMTIIASQPKKTPDLMNQSRSFPIQYFLYLGGIHHNSPIGQHMPKERYFTKPEFTSHTVDVLIVWRE
jgi:hypothetical protein